jgi:hypothetical protein
MKDLMKLRKISDDLYVEDYELEDGSASAGLAILVVLLVRLG